MGNRQGVFGLSRSWFYLTLFRGTPAEFTDNVDAAIQQANPVQAIVAIAEAAEAGIEHMVSVVTDIVSKDTISMDINTETAVIWYVG